MTRNEEHLRLLSIFHYVVAGLTAFFSLIPVIHVAVGLAIVFGALDEADGLPPELFGWFFVIMGAGAIVFGLSIAAVIALAGRFLTRRRHYTFCMVVAAISCIMIPFGTVLGVFTIVVLLREGVSDMFDSGGPQAAP